jgi:hypothetical protein
MHPEIEAMRKFPHMGSFTEAQRWIRQIPSPYTKRCECDLIQFTHDIFAVTFRGQIVGRGVTYETAIADAESNNFMRVLAIQKNIESRHSPIEIK